MTAGAARVHEPYRAGLPPLREYVASVWARRAFAFELARTELRSQQVNTVFGQLWLIINPLLLACVFFVLVDVLRDGTRGPGFFVHLAACVFAFTFVQQSVNHAAKSIETGSGLILNAAFPRALLPLSSVIMAFRRLLPTLAVYGVIHVAFAAPVSPAQLWAVPVLFALVLLATGLALVLAAAQVYFRDLRGFLPYALRAWLYVSPVLYWADEVPDRYDAVLVVNPIAPLLAAWSDALAGGRAPAPGEMALGIAWAAALFAGGAIFFLSREREFPVRL